ncbi:hypothetical protein C7444_10274 [Sphaerotilus hippei]|uniref:Cytokinin riboside 5'-monophosphate phosphoribohydrolase n=1 Tax=Sphaerotilus hippei TaxID=744406 RepID=A0A318H590_9BURK|nr:TIGR00730 family Rossman fold protein [Sphaerotilus hippei]PXW98597.1 hypothetical protein C7444_10274 [Sphaerotilus hippei]
MSTSPNPSPRPTSICVYCGSRDGADPAYAAAARALGEAIGRRGWRLVYGGGKVGLMGIVADAALQAGGTVLGVIPEHLLKLEVGHGSLTQLQVVQTMHERKHLMAEAADAFVALPGGIGTLEELYEVWTWQHLGFHRKPIALLDTRGYYQPLLAFMRHTVEQGFVSPAQAAVPLVASDVERLLEALEQHLGAAQPSDYRRI